MSRIDLTPDTLLRFTIRPDSYTRRVYIVYKRRAYYGYKLGDLPRAFNRVESDFINLLGLTFTTATNKKP
jgi:hypothetical protein